MAHDAAVGKISIGVKIFGIALSMLTLLILVVAYSAHKLKKVNQEINGLAENILPITDRVAEVDLHALEQELHYERVLKLYDQLEPNPQHIAAEIDLFQKRGDLVDEELTEAIALSKEAIENSEVEENRQEWAKIEPFLEKIELEHQELQEKMRQVFELLIAGEKDSIAEVRFQLIEEEEEFNQHLEAILVELEQFGVDASRNAQSHQTQVQQLGIITASLATIFGLFFAYLVTQGVVRPVRRLNQSLAMIHAGEFDLLEEIKSQDEIGFLSGAFNKMIAELKNKAALEETFGKYVDPRVVKSLLNSGEATNINGQKQNMTVLFSDVSGLSTMLENLSAEAAVKFTDQYLELFAEPISSNLGVIDKFIGTMVMGFWGPPFTKADEHPQLAAEAAIAQLNCLSKLQEILPDTENSPTLALHIGIATGDLVVGNMGSNRAKSYTVMGDTVNTASRLKGVSKQYGVPIIIANETYEQIKDLCEVRELDLIQVVGKEEPIRIYELLGKKDKITTEILQVRSFFALGLAAYRQQDWQAARNHFQDCLDLRPTDQPSKILYQRIEQFEQHSPGFDWDGVWQLAKK